MVRFPESTSLADYEELKEKGPNLIVNDYYVFFVRNIINDFTFEVLNCINCKEVDIEELRQKLT